MIPIVWREFKTLGNSLISIVLHFITPLFLLIFFATVLSKNLVTFTYYGESVPYLAFFTPGLIGYITFMTFQMAFTFIRHDKMSGMMGIIVLSQGHMKNYIGGKLFAQISINILKVIILVTLAISITQGNIGLFKLENMIVFLIAIILGSATWLCLGFTIALLINRDDIREVIVMIISMPLIFSSSMYYDISRAPSWIQSISIVNPLTYTCNLARKAYLLNNINNYSMEIIILLGMTLVALLLSIVISKRIEL